MPKKFTLDATELNFSFYSAVPSEYSDISTNSSDGGAEISTTILGERPFGDKTQLPSFRVDARPLIVGQGGKPSAVPISPATTNASAAEGGSASDENGVEVKRPDKAYLIANELLTTERHYVSRLHLIDQVRKILTFDFFNIYTFCLCNDHLKW
jgi:hypothetical protein